MNTFTHQGVTLRLGDCMPFMAGLADGAYSLAIVDPQYGIDAGNMKMGYSRHKRNNFDLTRPDDSFFAELFRVAKNQIIWGANYFILPPSAGFIFWFKHQNGDFSEGELAWSSMGKARLFDRPYQLDIGNKIHPTQKPVALYRWLLQNYARPGDTILDTHLGSGSSAIAAWEMGYTFTGIEIDADYFNAAVERFQKRISQPYIPGIVTPVKVEQVKLI